MLRMMQHMKFPHHSSHSQNQHTETLVLFLNQMEGCHARRLEAPTASFDFPQQQAVEQALLLLKEEAQPGLPVPEGLHTDLRQQVLVVVRTDPQQQELVQALQTILQPLAQGQLQRPEQEQAGQRPGLVVGQLQIHQSRPAQEQELLLFPYSPPSNLPSEAPQMIFARTVAWQLLPVKRYCLFHLVLLNFGTGPPLILSVFVVVGQRRQQRELRVRRMHQ